LAQLQNRQADIGIAEVPDVDIEKAIEEDAPAVEKPKEKEPQGAARNRRPQITGRAAAARQLIPTGNKQ
jgi:hypothetical protein